MDFHLSISNGFESSKIYDKRDVFDFDIVNFPFLDGDVSRCASFEVYISQLIMGLERFPLPLRAWDGLRYFIVALPEPSI